MRCYEVVWFQQGRSRKGVRIALQPENEKSEQRTTCDVQSFLWKAEP